MALLTVFRMSKLDGDLGYGQQNSDYQPVGLRFASLPALSSLSQKRNLISLPVLSD
jgi:hypothetical protein